MCFLIFFPNLQWEASQIVQLDDQDTSLQIIFVPKIDENSM